MFSPSSYRLGCHVGCHCYPIRNRGDVQAHVNPLFSCESRWGSGAASIIDRLGRRSRGGSAVRGRANAVTPEKGYDARNALLGSGEGPVDPPMAREEESTREGEEDPALQHGKYGADYAHE